MKRPRSPVRLVAQKQKLQGKPGQPGYCSDPLFCPAHSETVLHHLHLGTSSVSRASRVSRPPCSQVPQVPRVPQVPNHAGNGPHYVHYVTVLVEPLELAGHRQLPWGTNCSLHHTESHQTHPVQPVKPSSTQFNSVPVKCTPKNSQDFFKTCHKTFQNISRSWCNSAWNYLAIISIFILHGAHGCPRRWARLQTFDAKCKSLYPQIQKW